MFFIKEIEDTLENIKVWNMDTFPEATLGTQLLKLEEELKEHQLCKNDDLKELADVFIVVGGLRRFNSSIGYQFERLFSLSSQDMDRLLELVHKKMRINLKRNGRMLMGYYHHEE